MMRRSLYSKNEKWSSPLIDIMWDKSALMIDAKAGTLDIKAIGPMFQRALVEITEAIKAGQSNAKKSDGKQERIGKGTEASGEADESGGGGAGTKG